MSWDIRDSLRFVGFGMTGAVEDAVRHAVDFTVRHGSFILVASTTVGLFAIEGKLTSLELELRACSVELTVELGSFGGNLMLELHID